MTTPNAALLLIDFQQAVFDTPVAAEAEIILERLARLKDAARKAGLPVIMVQHEEAGTSFERDTPSWQWPAAIAPRDGEHLVAKESCDAFLGTELAALLTRLGVTDLYVCGYATEFCIDTSVRRAASEGYRVQVIADAQTTRNRPHLPAAAIRQHHLWVWEGMSVKGNPIGITQTDAVLGRWL
jgi:nicotinamidase-related amidase